MSATPPPTIKKYQLEYNLDLLALVEVDFTKAEDLIKEMVQFWSGWMQRLQRNKDDYLKTWLHQLGMFLVNNRRVPNQDDEGWYPLDGTHGIKLVDWWEYEHDELDLTITEKS